MRTLSILILILCPIVMITAQEVDSIIDIRDGQVYKIVKIGDQWWMQENLNIGTRIDASQLAEDNDLIEKYCYWDNPQKCGVFGGLYRWDEMMGYKLPDSFHPRSNQGICPAGWYIPSDDAWIKLEMHLGMSQTEAYRTSVRGTDEGGKLKQTGTSSWLTPNTGATNESGFTALPAGYLADDQYMKLYNYTYFWTTTSIRNERWTRFLSNNLSGIGRISDVTDENSYSVRCLRDSAFFAYLTISDERFRSVVRPKFYGSDITQKILLINSSAADTIHISSLYTDRPVFILDKDSATLVTGDSIVLSITFNPEQPGEYGDYLSVESNDPYNSLIKLPLYGKTHDFDSIVDKRDGQVYKTIQIGRQTWMAENIRATKYSDGTQVVDGTYAGDILEDKTTKYYFWYNDDPANHAETYGALYTWTAAMNGTASSASNPSGIQGICPDDWHMPSYDEWSELEIFLGGSELEKIVYGHYVSFVGGELKEYGTEHWMHPNPDASNSSGFTALPGSLRIYDGSYKGLGEFAYFWTTSKAQGIYPWDNQDYFPMFMMLNNENNHLSRNYGNNNWGFSVRCVRDYNLSSIVNPELTKDYQLKIYPNPVSFITCIEFPNLNQESNYFVLSDICGKVLKTQSNISESHLTLDCSDLISGIYFVELRGEKVYRGKLVVKK